MQVALLSVGGSAGWARRVADSLVRAQITDLDPADVILLDGRPVPAAQAVVRPSDVLVLLVGAGGLAGVVGAAAPGGVVGAAGLGGVVGAAGPGGVGRAAGLGGVVGAAGPGGVGPQPLEVAAMLVEAAASARHVTVLALVRGPVDGATGRWLDELQVDHLVYGLRRLDSPDRGAAPADAAVDEAKVGAVADSSIDGPGDGPSGGRGEGPGGGPGGGSVDAEDEAVLVVSDVLAERRRCLTNARTSEVSPYDRAGEPREGRTLDEVGLGDPRTRSLPSSDLEALGRLDRANADEQWNEAVQAWGLELWEPMVEHLQRALLLRPLDAEAGLWLARILAASQSASHRAEAARRATDAARIAERRGRVHWAAAAWLWVARFNRSEDPPAAAAAASRAAALVPHRAEPWVERALQALEVDDVDGAAQAALQAYRRHERSLHVLAQDPLARADPVALAVVTDTVRRASVDRVVQLVQLASALELGRPGAAYPGSAGTDAGRGGALGPVAPIGATTSDALVALSPHQLVSEARRLTAVIYADVALRARERVAEAHVLLPTFYEDQGGHRRANGDIARDLGGGVRGGRGGREGADGRRARRRLRVAARARPGGALVDGSRSPVVNDVESLLWGALGAGVIGLCGLGLWWVTGSAIWLPAALVLMAVSLLTAYRAATEDAPPLPPEPPDMMAATAGSRLPDTSVAGGGPGAGGGAAGFGVVDGEGGAGGVGAAGGVGGAGSMPPPPPAPPPARSSTWPPPELAARTPLEGWGAGADGLDPVSSWRDRLHTLRLVIDRAEELTLDWPRLGPAVPAYRAALGDLVTQGLDGGGRVFVLDNAWLPEELRELAGPGAGAEIPAAAPARADTTTDGQTITTDSAASHLRRPALYRVVSIDGTVAHAARWATYFGAPDAGPPA